MMISVLTAFIAAIVALITFLQWVTAREKVRLDLFDKRFAVYDELRSAMSRHLRGNTETAFPEFEKAASRARFLFGPEVQAFLEDREKDLDREMTLLLEGRRDAAAAERAALVRRLTDFFRDFDQLVAPYMNHHQKVLPSVSRFRNLPWRSSKL
jgi:hypothetical protein